MTGRGLTTGSLLALAYVVVAWMASAKPVVTIVPGPPLPALRSHPDWTAPALSDAESIDAIVAAFDATISVPAGGKLNRDRLRGLFLPGGRIVVEVDPKPSLPADAVLLTPDEYANLSDLQTVRSGFHDRVVANRVEQFGAMAHVYSVYQSRHEPSDARPFARGIKSFELLLSDGRWRIVQVFYERERPGTSIPPDWLTGRPT